MKGDILVEPMAFLVQVVLPLLKTGNNGSVIQLGYSIPGGMR